MKLRITYNSIRVRVRKSELALLQEKQAVGDCVCFPNGVIFKFVLTINKEINTVHATLIDDFLNLSIPHQIALDWMNSNRVSIETHLPLPDAAQLHVLIEKDFPCLDRPKENKADTFWELATKTDSVC